jgi:drug/metabolite transporter (DMT)-like permease
MLAGALCFAAMGGFTHALGPRCDWLVVALVRTFVMFLGAVALARATGVRLVLADPPTLWVRSLAGSVSLVCNFYAMSRLPVAEALSLSNSYPLWIVVLAAVALRERPTLGEALGVACGLAGVALIERPRLDGDGFAALVALFGAIATAVAMLGLNRLRRVGTAAVVAHFAGVACVVSAVGVASRPSAITPGLLAPATLALLLGVAATGTVGQLCLTRAYAGGKPARLAVVGLSQVVFALGLDIAFWHRRPTAAMLMGFALVMAPAVWLGRAGAGRLGRLHDRVEAEGMGCADERSPARQETRPLTARP